MIDLSFKTMKSIAREAFEFGKELELVKDGDFEKIFSDEKLKKEHIPQLKPHLKVLIDHQFLWVDDIYRYFINDTPKEIIKGRVRVSKHGDVELVHYRERYLGLQLIVYAEDQGKYFGMPFFSSGTDQFVEKIISLLPKDFLLSKEIKYQEESQIGNFIFNTKYGKVQGSFDYSQTNNRDDLFLLRLLNPLITKALKGKIIVRVERTYDDQGYLLIPFSKAHLEDNPYIPFYYKHNLRVIDKDPLTQADLDHALERYSQPPKDGGKWVFQFLGKVPKQYMKPSGWKISYKKFGHARPKL